MSIAYRFTLLAGRLSEWIARHPTGARIIGLAIALAAAAVSGAMGHGIAFADPYVGGGSSGG